MYKEVAFDPCCLRSFEYYSLLKQHFGFDKGRYVAAERRTWAQEAMTAVKQAGLPVIREQSIKNYLNKLPRSRERDEFLTAPDRPKGDHQLWSVWLNNQLQVRPFDVTISEPAQEGRLDIDSINNGHQEWNVPASLSVLREAKAIVGSVLGLLRLSSEVTLIDPYFYLAGNKTLSEIFVALQSTSVRTVRVVSSVNPLNPQQVYQREYQNLNRRGVSLEWVVAPEKYFHDRYLITDVGAIRVGHGFVEDIVKGIHADQLNINLIGIAEAQRTQESLNILLDEGRATRITVV
jgi:hypothetical protein